MNLNIDFLRTFITVADTGGFTNAGRLVHRSQAAVSMQIKRLESEVGSQLFERCGTSVKLTPDGIRLLAYARRIIKEHDEATVALSRPHQRETIRFGSPEDYMSGILPNLLKQFSSSFPDARVEISFPYTIEIKKMIQNGGLDIGLCTQNFIGGQVIYNDPIVWASKPGFKIEKGKCLSVAVFDTCCMFSKWALEALDKAGLSYTICYVSQTIAGMIDTVRSGLALAPLAKGTVPSDLVILGQDDGLPILPVSNVALHFSRSSRSPALSCFSDLLIKSFEEKTRFIDQQLNV